MKDTSMTSRYATYAVMACILLLSVIISHVSSAFMLSERSMQLSSSSVATVSTYTVGFTARQAASAFVIDFCSNTPLIGQTCTTPTNFSAEDADSNDPVFNDVTGSEGRVVVAGEINEDDEISVTVAGILNPSVDGVMYARIVTFDTKQNALDSTPTSLAGNRDEGTVAIAITPTIGVSGTVLETMTFCVSADPVDDDCETVTPPALTLGQEEDSDVGILQAGVLSQADLHVQLTTNAYGGAIVYLKNAADGCGGLLLVGGTGCYIQPAQDSDINPAADQARFGVKTSPATPTPTRTATGVLQPADGSYYGNDVFALRFTAGENPASGVTSAFGDPLLDTAGAPASNQNMRLTFGVTIAGDTPAGTYATKLGLIATGRF